MSSQKCEGCHGEIRSTRKITLEQSITNHAASCPARGVKRKEVPDDDQSE